MNVRLRPLPAGVVVAAALLAVMVLGSGDSTHAASTFTPTVSVCIGTLDADGVCSTATTPPTAGKPSDITAALCIGGTVPDPACTAPIGTRSTDVNFAAFIAYIPKNWGVVTGDKIPIGVSVGRLDAHSVLGLVNGACNTPLPVQFDMQNGSINRDDTVSFQDKDEGGTPDFADDKDGNGLFDAVDKYPDWLNRIFVDMQPIRRSIGITAVAGTPVILQFLIFPPGTELDPAIPHDEGLGFPSVTVLQAIGDPAAIPAPSVINDFCTPLSTTNVSFGTTSDGDQLLVNPSDGTYTFNSFALGQRDADGDSYENSLDTCPLNLNVGNPRVPNDGDLDGDGLDAACDPNDNPSTGTDSDQDRDGYQNRGDNCPLVLNGQEQDNVSGVGNQLDTDRDTIGDACDPNPTTADTEGTYSVATPSADATIGAGGSAAGSPPTTAQCPNCWTTQTVINPGGASTVAPSGSGTSGSSTPTISASPTSGSSSSNSGTIIAVVAGVVAAVIIIGGGVALLMRRNKGV